MLTHLSTPDCNEAHGPGDDEDGIRYSLTALAGPDNIYTDLDIGNSGWLSWDSNFGVVGFI